MLRILTPTARLALALVAVLASGCESFFLPDAPEAESRVVVDGAFSPDSVWSVRLTRLRLLGEERPGPAPEGYVVGDATVVVTSQSGDGASLVLGHVGGGRYESPSGTGPVPGTTYGLVVDHPTLGRASATGMAPAAPAFDVSPAVYVDDEGAASEPTERHRFRITLHGTGDGVSYAVAVRQRRPAYDGEIDASVRLRPVPFTSDDPDLRAYYFDVGPVRTFTRFNDGAVLRVPVPAGATREIELLATATRFPESGDEFVVEVTAVNGSLREFLYTLSLQDQYGRDPFVGPVPLASNVEGGLGIFDGFTRSTHTVALETR